jgi:hypothetical protein
MSILGFRLKQHDAPHRCPKHNVRYALRRNVNHGALVEPIRCVTSKPVVGPETRRGFAVEAGRDGQGAATLRQLVMKRSLRSFKF